VCVSNNIPVSYGPAWLQVMLMGNYPG